VRLGILICARNEGETVGTVVEEFQQAASGITQDFVVLVVDDGSVDETASRAARAGADVQVIWPGKGLAWAFSVGTKRLLAMGVSHIAHVDADGQYVATDLPRLVAELAEGAELVIGDRLWRRPDGMTRTKYILNRAFSSGLGRAVGQELTDTQSGFRVFTARIAQNCQVSATYTYTQAQVLGALAQRCKVVNVPIAFLPRRNGKSRLMRSPAHYMTRVLLDLFRLLSPRDRSRVVSRTALCRGVVVCAWEITWKRNPATASRALVTG
jgi:glycosyltransferase involved in cell wall biosynthesis